MAPNITSERSNLQRRFPAVTPESPLATDAIPTVAATWQTTSSPTRETADYLKLSDEQFAELPAGPRPIPSFELLPGLRRYRLSDLKRWLDEAMSASSAAAHPEGPAAASLAASTGEAPIDLPWGVDLVVGEAIAPLRAYPHARQPWMRR